VIFWFVDFFYRTPIYISRNTLVPQKVAWENAGTYNAVPVPKHLAMKTNKHTLS